MFVVGDDCLRFRQMTHSLTIYFDRLLPRTIQYFPPAAHKVLSSPTRHKFSWTSRMIRLYIYIYIWYFAGNIPGCICPRIRSKSNTHSVETWLCLFDLIFFFRRCFIIGWVSNSCFLSPALDKSQTVGCYKRRPKFECSYGSNTAQEILNWSHDVK